MPIHWMGDCALTNAAAQAASFTACAAPFPARTSSRVICRIVGGVPAAGGVCAAAGAAKTNEQPSRTKRPRGDFNIFLGFFASTAEVRRAGARGGLVLGQRALHVGNSAV